MATFTSSTKMCVYTITNKLNGLVYVGSTKNTAKTRWKDHRHYRPGISGSISQLISVHGVENFEFKVIDTASTRQELNGKEAYWIEKLDTIYPKGYNRESGGISGYKPHRESIERMRSKQVGNKYHNTPVVRSDGMVFASIKSAEEALGVHPRSVTRVLMGVRKSIKGYSFAYLDRKAG